MIWWMVGICWMNTNEDYYSYNGSIYRLFLETDIEIGAVKISNVEKTSLADLVLISKKKWIKAVRIPKQIAQRLIAVKF